MRLSGLSGLGTTLSPNQIFQTALGAGFSPSVATQMTAIALRESSGNPNATAIISSSQAAPGAQAEQSYGLWQINVLGNPGLMSQLGITDPSQLLDPATNARAAYLLYNNNPANLNTAWYINRPGYQQAYEANLPAAEQAASDVLGSDPLLAPSTSTDSTLPPTDLNTSISNVLSGNINLSDPTTIVLVGLALATLAFIASES